MNYDILYYGVTTLKNIVYIHTCECKHYRLGRYVEYRIPMYNNYFENYIGNHT